MRGIIFKIIAISILLLVSVSVYAAEPVYPEYIRNARTLVDKAEAKSAELNSFTDDVLIARNFFNNAESEYKKNLGSWSGKLDEKAEPVVRYFAAMAEIQASVVLAKAGKAVEEKERIRVEKLLADAKAKIKVFDDKNAEIAAIKKGLTELNSAFLALKEEKEKLVNSSSAMGTDMTQKTSALASAERRVATLTAEVESCSKALAESDKKAIALASASDQKVAQLTAQIASEQEQSRGEISKLKAELASLAAAKGAVETQSKEQIEALNRVKQFNEAVGKLGGVMKATADGTTVILPRTPLFKTAGKTTVLSPEGEKNSLRIIELMKNFNEYRAVIKVHGFGTPAKNEDAAATDYMARLFREELVVKGKIEPTAVEAMGVGTSSPIYAKGNIDGNRRVEITFVKR